MRVCGYMKKNRMGIFFGVSCTLIVLAVFWLYRLPLQAVLYAWLLCAVLAVFVVGNDFLRFCRKCEELERLKGHAGEYLEPFPDTGDPIECLYQELVTACQEEKNRILTREEEKRSEMTDYYTMWVHQVKTPISAMNLMLQSGLELDSGRLCAQLFKIEQYVEMVLQYLRADSPTADLVIRETDLDSVIKKAVHKYAPVFIRTKLSLNYEPVSCRVVTDEKWLLFVVEQVLSNALKYTEHGGISIYMDKSSPGFSEPRGGESPAGGRRLVLVVEDTGSGISPEDMPRVFEKGYTGNNGRANQRSTGIGLYLCQKIMTRLSHVMTIESEPGVGTKVKLRLDTVKIGPE